MMSISVESRYIHMGYEDGTFPTFFISQDIRVLDYSCTDAVVTRMGDWTHDWPHGSMYSNYEVKI